MSEDPLIERYLDIITKAIEIMATQAEGTAALQTAVAILDRVAPKITDLLVEIATLKDLAASASQVNPELQAGIDAVTKSAAGIEPLLAP